MMRLSQYLFRWTGDAQYADYWERNLYNGIFAQGYWEDETAEMLMAPHDRKATTVAYYLPMVPGAQKRWGSELDHFWCCHCTLLQANAVHHESIYYQFNGGVAVAQYMDSTAETEVNGIKVNLRQTFNSQTGGDMLTDSPVNREVLSRPSNICMNLRITAEQPVEFSVRLRIPGWMAGGMTVWVNGKEETFTIAEGNFAQINHVWQDDILTVRIGKELTCCPLPDDPDMVAFLDGPVCLAGLVSEEHLLYGDIHHPVGTILCADDERHWQQFLWQSRGHRHQHPLWDWRRSFPFFRKGRMGGYGLHGRLAQRRLQTGRPVRRRDGPQPG
jgi:DUF1680 family protein